MMPILLPHELVVWFMETKQAQRMKSTCRKAWQGHFAWCCKDIGADPTSSMPLAVWADAVPHAKR
eukprot:5130510-Lingulodinium_polyedra.AAC.1